MRALFAWSAVGLMILTLSLRQIGPCVNEMATNGIAYFNNCTLQRLHHISAMINEFHALHGYYPGSNGKPEARLGAGAVSGGLAFTLRDQLEKRKLGRRWLYKKREVDMTNANEVVLRSDEFADCNNVLLIYVSRADSARYYTSTEFASNPANNELRDSLVRRANQASADWMYIICSAGFDGSFGTADDLIVDG